jgi:xanthine dehydrogenase molybdopterin-binding subunit B
MKPFRSWPISDCYKIPAIGDIPKDFRVAFLTDAEQPGNIYGSKAVGEPPLMVICCLLFAICHSPLATVPSIQPWGASVGRKSVFWLETATHPL